MLPDSNIYVIKRMSANKHIINVCSDQYLKIKSGKLTRLICKITLHINIRDYAQRIYFNRFI